MRLIPLAALAAVVALAAGCGGAGTATPGAANGAASVVPADAVAFVSVGTDLSSPAWHGLGTSVLDSLPSGLGGDLQEVAGDEVDVAVLPSGKAVAFVQPRDAQKLADLARKDGAKLRTVGDWTAASDDQAALDAVAAATTHLADNTLFLDATGRLPDDALARLYVNGGEAGRALPAVKGPLGLTAPSGAAPGVQQFSWLAAALTSTDEGLKLDGVASRAGLSSPPANAPKPVAPYRADLLDRIPAGVLAAVDFRLPDGALSLLRGATAGLGPGAATLPSDLDALLGGESALYVRGGLPMPEVTLVTRPADTAAAEQALGNLLKGLPQGTPAAGVQLHHATVDGRLVVSTAAQGVDAFRGGEAKLGSDAAFEAAAKQAGLPERTSGFLYVNLKDALALADLTGMKQPANLPDLRSLLAFGSDDGREATFTAFVGVHGS